MVTFREKDGDNRFISRASWAGIGERDSICLILAAPDHSVSHERSVRPSVLEAGRIIDARFVVVVG